MLDEAAVDATILAEDVELFLANPAELDVLGPLDHGSGEVSPYADEEVELATAMTVELPVGDVSQDGLVGDFPSCFLAHFAVERLAQMFPLFYVAADDVPATREELAVVSSAMDEGATELVMDQCPDDRLSAVALRLLLERREVDFHRAPGTLPISVHDDA